MCGIWEVVLILLLSTCAVLYTGNKVTINVGSLIDVSDLAPRCNCEGNELQQVQLACHIAIYMHHTLLAYSIAGPCSLTKESTSLVK